MCISPINDRRAFDRADRVEPVRLPRVEHEQIRIRPFEWGSIVHHHDIEFRSSEIEIRSQTEFDIWCKSQSSLKETVSAAGQQNRTYEAAILKTLGATRRRILMSFALRSALLGTAAGLVALTAGIIGGWAVSFYVLETDYEVIWGNALAIVAGGVIATLLAGLAFAAAPLATKPARTLRSAD